jgi:hypothetical protein
MSLGAARKSACATQQDERLNLDGGPSLGVPAPIHPTQFDGVALGVDCDPHPFTIGSQQDRFNPGPALVPNDHPHCNSTSTSLS